MTNPRLRVVVAGLGWLIAFLGTGCSAILGISDDPIVVSPSGKSCLLTSECKDGEICLFARCSVPCAANRDCDEAHGERCLKVDEGTACVSDDRTACGTDAGSCPGGTSCVATRCLSACGEDAGACPGDQVCSSDHACHADESAGGHRDAGVPGSHRDGGLTGGHGDGGLTGGHSDAGGGDAGSASGEPCTSEGALRCEGTAQAARSICQGGKWRPTDPCVGAMLCDSTGTAPGTCRNIEPSCVGHKPGDSFCTGATRIVCGPDLVNAETTECKTSAHCSSVMAGCAACLDNEFVCDTNKLTKCKPDHSGFELEKTCTDSNAPCSAQAGDCTPFVCSPMQKRCNGDKLEQCNPAQSAFVLLETCTAGLCDSQALQCDKCVAKATSCASGMVRTCSDDGQTQADKACPAASPFCVGTGSCVACLSSTNCAATSAPICDPGLLSCRGCKPGSGDAECNARYGAIAPACTVSGACAKCTSSNPAQCKGTTPLCDDSTNSCVECVKSSDCATSKPICSGGVCTTCTNDAQCTGKNNGLNACQVGTGTCVECVTNTHCGGNDVCESNNTCCTPEARSTTCGANTCGNQFNNCGVSTSCGTCGTGHCCPSSADPDVNNCQGLQCD